MSCLLVACAPRSQTETQALQTLCDLEVNAGKLPVDFVEAGRALGDLARQRLSHPRAREILDLPSAAERAQRLQAWSRSVDRACSLLASPLMVDLPNTDRGPQALLKVTSTRVSMAAAGVGTRVALTLEDGRVAPEHVGEGHRLPPLEGLVGEQMGGVHVIAADRNVPYATLLRVLFSTRRARTGSLLLARGREGTVVVPVPLPSSVPAPEQLSLYVQVSREHVALWSASGRVGTVSNPRFKAKRTRAAFTALAESIDDVFEELGYVQPADLQVFIMVGPSLTVDDLMAALDSVHSVKRVELEPFLIEGLDEP